MTIQLINTLTTHIGKSLIYQLTGQFLNQFKIKKPGSVTWLAVKWAETELNRRHMDFQSIALPTELSALKSDSKFIEIENKNKIKIFFYDIFLN